MSDMTLGPGEPRPAGQPSDWFKWVTGQKSVYEGRRTPQIGEYRNSGQPSDWFKSVVGRAAALPTDEATQGPATDVPIKRGAEQPFTKKPKASPTKSKYKSVIVAHLRELRARVAQSRKANRKLAAEVKSRLPSDHDCPYCGSALGADKHADHIHPISKGGLSTEANMVWVCVECNLRKRSMTLAAFIKKFRLDRTAIEGRLEALGKDF